MLGNEGREMIVGEINAPPLDQKDVVVNHVQIHSKENCDNVLCSESKFGEGREGAGGDFPVLAEKIIIGSLAGVKRRVSLENRVDQRAEHASQTLAFQNKLCERLALQEKMKENLAFQSTLDEIPPTNENGAAPPFPAAAAAAAGFEGPFSGYTPPHQNNEGSAFPVDAATVSFSFPPRAVRSTLSKGFSLENQSFDLGDLNQLDE